MKSLKSKKMIAVMVTLTSLMALTGCGSSDTDDKTSNQSYSNAAVTDSEAVTEENGTKQNVAQTSTDVSIEGLLSHAETPAEDFTYYVLDDCVNIEGYVGTDPVVVIPESIEGYPVKTVANLSGKGIRAIKFSDSMEAISGSLFLSDEEIQYVVFGANIKTVGEYAFLFCSNMKEIQLNDTLEKIGGGALAVHSNDLMELHIPESVTEIEASGFNMDATQTIYVKAGSYAETYCVEKKENFPDLTYIVE